MPNAVKSHLCAIRFKGKTVPEIYFAYDSYGWRDLCSDISHTLHCAHSRHICECVHRPRRNPTCCFSFLCAWKTSLKIWRAIRQSQALTRLSHIGDGVMRTSCNDKDRQVIVIASKPKSRSLKEHYDCLSIVKLANMAGQDLMGSDWHILKIHLFHLALTRRRQ